MKNALYCFLKYTHYKIFQFKPFFFILFPEKKQKKKRKKIDALIGAQPLAYHVVKLEEIQCAGRQLSAYIHARSSIKILKYHKKSTGISQSFSFLYIYKLHVLVKILIKLKFDAIIKYKVITVFIRLCVGCVYTSSRVLSYLSHP